MPASKIKDFEGGFQSLSKSKTGKMFIEQVRVVAGDMQSVDDLARLGFSIFGFQSMLQTLFPPASAPLAVYTCHHFHALYYQWARVAPLCLPAVSG